MGALRNKAQRKGLENTRVGVGHDSGPFRSPLFLRFGRFPCVEDLRAPLEAIWGPEGPKTASKAGLEILHGEPRKEICQTSKPIKR